MCQQLPLGDSQSGEKITNLKNNYSNMISTQIGIWTRGYKHMEKKTPNVYNDTCAAPWPKDVYWAGKEHRHWGN